MSSPRRHSKWPALRLAFLSSDDGDARNDRFRQEVGERTDVLSPPLIRSGRVKGLLFPFAAGADVGQVARVRLALCVRLPRRSSRMTLMMLTVVAISSSTWRVAWIGFGLSEE